MSSRGGDEDWVIVPSASGVAWICDRDTGCRLGSVAVDDGRWTVQVGDRAVTARTRREALDGMAFWLGVLAERRWDGQD